MTGDRAWGIQVAKGSLCLFMANTDSSRELEKVFPTLSTQVHILDFKVTQLRECQQLYHTFHFHFHHIFCIICTVCLLFLYYMSTIVIVSLTVIRGMGHIFPAAIFRSTNCNTGGIIINVSL